MKIVLEDFNGNVEEFINELSKLPKNYIVSITGVHTFSIGQDDESKTILIDDPP